MDEFDEKALAALYERALGLEKCGDLETAAAVWREMLRIDPHDHCGAAMRLAGMGCAEPPPRAASAYVATLFDQHAEVFDSILVDHLGYGVPDLLRAMLGKHALTRFSRLLDLGCGTGLAGEALQDIVDHVTGVDLSENMIAMARERELYDELFVGEIVEFLRRATGRWDLVVATDVLPYLGALGEFFAAVSGHLRRRGVFAFSTESLPPEIIADRPFMVGPKQRFAHAQPYLEAVLAKSGMDVVAIERIVVRHEEGLPVDGQIFLARRRD